MRAADADRVLHLLPAKVDHPSCDDWRRIAHKRCMMPAALSDAGHSDMTKPHCNLVGQDDADDKILAAQPITFRQ